MHEVPGDFGAPLESKRKRLTPEEKFDIFIQSCRGDTPLAEILRRHGIYSSDLQRIRETVRQGALKELRLRSKRSREKTVSRDEHERLKMEKERLEKALLEHSIELSLLKKRVNGV